MAVLGHEPGDVLACLDQREPGGEVVITHPSSVVEATDKPSLRGCPSRAHGSSRTSTTCRCGPSGACGCGPVTGSKASACLPLLEGAVGYAASCGAPAVEGYPADNDGERVDTTMAFVGTRALFQRAVFTLAARTDAVAGGFPRVLMRKQLA